MKKMLKTAATILLALTAALGCKCKNRIAVSIPHAERKLILANEKPFFSRPVTTVDVTGWEEGKDAVLLGEPFYRYPWQGEDSIRYYIGYEDEIWVLKVEGKTVGVDLVSLDCHEASRLANRGQIIAVRDHGLDTNKLKLFPNLRMLTLELSGYALRKNPLLFEELGKLPDRVEVYLFIDTGWWWEPRECDVTDEQLERLAGLSNLRELRLSSHKITDTGLCSIATLKNLRMLSIRGASFTNKGLEALSHLTELRELRISSSSITSSGLRHIATFTHLRILGLHGKRITDRGLRHLQSLTNLRELDLRSTSIRGWGLRYLDGLANLRSLDLSSTKVGDFGLRYLKGPAGLREVDLSDTKVTSSGRIALEKRLPDCHQN